jgi:hypothetical protein
MASYKERLRFLTDRGFVGIGWNEDHTKKILYCESIEITIPHGVKTVEEAIDVAIENGIGGATHGV